jgi:hypothetical protein
MDRFEKYVQTLKEVPSEFQSSETWKYCTQELVMRGGIGTAVGATAALLLFRPGRSFGRGVTLGLAAGAGIGSAYEQCNARFNALQATQSPAPSADKRGI